MNASQLQSTVDVYPGESEHLDVVARVEGEPNCYVCNDDNYSHENWRNPDGELGHSLWLVEVVIISSGKKCIDHFRLVNNGPFQSLRLEEARQEEREIIRNRN